MSDSSSQSDPDATLYNPPSEKAESFTPDDDQEEIRLEIPSELADSLLEVALHLGLSPSMVASRAIGLICNEISLVEDEGLTPGALIQKYQSRIDLLHNLDYDLTQGVEADAEGASSFSWDDVDDIIQQGEASSRAEPRAYFGDEEGTEGNDAFTPAPDVPTASLDEDDIPTEEDDVPPDDPAATDSTS